MNNTCKVHYRQLLLLAMVIAGSNFIVKHFFNLSFDYKQINAAWQLLDVQLLKTNLLQSLWYLHSQPPMFNLFTGIVLKIFPQHYASAFEYIFMFLGIMQSWLLYLSLYEICSKKSVAFFTSACFAISPSFLLYENWFFYTFIAMCGLTFSVFFLIKFLKTKQIKWAFTFFSCLALLCLTMSMFHLVWLIFIVVLFCVLLKNYKTKIILSALIPLLLVGGWYTKNLVLFNHFTSSTWFGMNISRVILPTPLKIQNNTTKDTINSIVNIGAFKCINEYQQWLPVNYNTPAIKSLQEIHKSSGFCNYNNIEYIPVSEKFQQASIAFFKINPVIYFRNVITSNILYYATASNYFYLTNNREKLGLYDKLLNLDVTPVYKSYIGLDNFILITLYAFIFFYVIKILRKNYKEKQVNKTNWKWQDITVIFAACNILFFIAIGNFLELGESNRFRFQVIPLLLIMFVYAYYNFRLQKQVI